MASVQELIALAEAEKRPNGAASVMQNFLAGVQSAQTGAVDRAVKLVQLEQARREMAAQEEMKRQIQGMISAQNEQNTQSGLNSVAGPGKAVLPTQKLKKKISQDEKGRYSVSWETQESPKQAEAPAGYRWSADGNLEAIPGGPADKKNAPSTQTPPAGYRWKPDGTLEAISGGPADQKIKAGEKKERNLEDSTIGQADRIMTKVDQALGKVNNWSAGVGSVMKSLPTSDARNLAADLTTIKANIGFSQLQEMRRNSPTGGALGQVAVQELEFLQAAIDNLDQGQGPEQLKAHLQAVKTHYDNWKKAVLQARGESGAEAPGASGKTGAGPKSDPLGIR